MERPYRRGVPTSGARVLSPAESRAELRRNLVSVAIVAVAVMVAVLVLLGWL
jgi:hypothetical protein